jgi:hypothetical protein
MAARGACGAKYIAVFTARKTTRHQTNTGDGAVPVWQSVLKTKVGKVLAAVNAASTLVSVSVYCKQVTDM